MSKSFDLAVELMALKAENILPRVTNGELDELFDFMKELVKIGRNGEPNARKNKIRIFIRES